MVLGPPSRYLAWWVHSPAYRADMPKRRLMSMSDFQDPIHHTSVGTPRWVGLAVGILGGISLVSLGLGWTAINSAKSAEQATQTTLKQANDTLNQRLAKSDEINQQLQSDLKVVTDKLNLTHEQLVSARKQNKATA